MILEEQVVEKHWEPNSGKQSLYLGLPDSIFEQFYGGAAGGGKSEALMMRPILRQWINYPRFQGLILRRTYKELEESLIERSKRGSIIDKEGNLGPSFYDFGGEYNEQKKRWRFESGATITFGHAEEEEDVRKYDTAEYQYIGFDELTSFTEFQYKFLAFSRCRSTIPGVPALVCSASNPGNIGHRWVRERFVEPSLKDGKITQRIVAERIPDPSVPEGYRLIKRIFIQAFLSDNPKLMENDPLYLARLHMLPEADKKAKLYGDWWTFEGQVFGEFRKEPFADEPSHARHILFNESHKTYFDMKKVVVYKEFSCVKTSVETWAAQLANICMKDHIDPLVVIDPSAWQNRGQGTIADQFSDEWKKVYGKRPRVEKADNDRIGGKMLIHDYLRWKERPQLAKEINEVYNKEKADWIFRNRGLESYRAYLALFQEQRTTINEELPKLVIGQQCKILTETIPLCVYDEKNIEDVKEFSGDDPYDCFRYFLKTVDRYKLEDLPHILAIDWGYSAMTYAMWGTSSMKLAETFQSGYTLNTPSEIDWNKVYLRAELKKQPTGPQPVKIGRRRGFRVRH